MLNTPSIPLIETNQNITPNAGRQVYFGLEVKLDTNRQRGGFQVALVIDRSPEQVA